MGQWPFRAMPRLCGAALTLLLAGCSTVQNLAGLEHAGFQSDGSYVLSDEERSLGCRLLQERATKLVAGFSNVPDAIAAEQKAVPGTMTAVFKRTFGSPGEGLTAQENFQRNYVQAVALNEQMVEKGCQPVDIEGQLGGKRATPASMTH